MLLNGTIFIDIYNFLIDLRILWGKLRILIDFDRFSYFSLGNKYIKRRGY